MISKDRHSDDRRACPELAEGEEESGRERETPSIRRGEFRCFAPGDDRSDHARRRRSVRRIGLTLLEVIIAISLIVMLMAALLTFYWQTVEVRALAMERSARTQVARQVLERIAIELRGCVGFETFGFPLEHTLVGQSADEDGFDELAQIEQEPVETEDSPLDAAGLLGNRTGGTVPLLLGDRRSITFLTTVLPAEHQYEIFGEFDELPPAQHDLTQVSYWLWVDQEETDDDGNPVVGGIVRTEKKTLNQFLIDAEDPLELRNDLWSHELGYLEFRYFDGVEWDTKWDLTQGNSLPQMVMVTVGYEPVTDDELNNLDLDEFPVEEYPFGDDFEHPDRYSIVVRIPAADRFFGTRFEHVGRQLAEDMGLEGLP